MIFLAHDSTETTDSKESREYMLTESLNIFLTNKRQARDHDLFLNILCQCHKLFLLRNYQPDYARFFEITELKQKKTIVDTSPKKHLHNRIIEIIRDTLLNFYEYKDECGMLNVTQLEILKKKFETFSQKEIQYEYIDPENLAEPNDIKIITFLQTIPPERTTFLKDLVRSAIDTFYKEALSKIASDERDYKPLTQQLIEYLSSIFSATITPISQVKATKFKALLLELLSKNLHKIKILAQCFCRLNSKHEITDPLLRTTNQEAIIPYLKYIFTQVVDGINLRDDKIQLKEIYSIIDDTFGKESSIFETLPLETSTRKKYVIDFPEIIKQCLKSACPLKILHIDLSNLP